MGTMRGGMMRNHSWTLQEKMEVGKILKGIKTEAEVAESLGHSEHKVRQMVSRMEDYKKNPRR